MAEGFQRGETVDFNVYVRDEDGDVLNIAGGVLSVLVKQRSLLIHTLTVGSGLQILDAAPPQAGDGEEQEPHAIATLSDAQTAPMAPGRVLKVQTKFVDSTGRVFLTPEQYLDDVVLASTLNATLGGRQGPSGPSGEPFVPPDSDPIDAADVTYILGFVDGEFVWVDPASFGGVTPPPAASVPTYHLLGF